MSRHEFTVTKEECELKVKVMTATLDLIYGEIKEMRDELKTSIEWQNQFKGGLKAFGILVGLAGTIGGIIYSALKIMGGKNG